MVLGKPEVPGSTRRLHDETVRLMTRGGMHMAPSLMGLIAAVTNTDSELKNGSKITVNGKPGEFVCYWRGRARVKLDGDDAAFSVCEIDEVTGV